GSLTPTISTNPVSFSSRLTRKSAPSNRLSSVPGGSVSGVKRDAGGSGERKIPFRPSSAERSDADADVPAEKSSKRTVFRLPSSRASVTAEVEAKLPERPERTSAGRSQNSCPAKKRQ